MKRYVFTLNLKDAPGIVETYTRYHRDVWPEVQASLRRVGVEQMDIYVLGRRLVMVVDMRDGVDYLVAFQSHASSSQRVAEWERLMKTLQQPPAEARPGEWWAAMEPVFHLGAHSTEQQEPTIAHVADRPRTS
jgi:L-rhamnose mutarotase